MQCSAEEGAPAVVSNMSHYWPGQNKNIAHGNPRLVVDLDVELPTPLQDYYFRNVRIQITSKPACSDITSQ